MQTSMWKLLTATGIIGIGTLVVLEVQNRLPAQSQTAGSSQAPDIGNPVESVVIPDSTTDLDRMLAGDIGFDDPQFTLDDPPFTLDEPTSPKSSGEVAPELDQIGRTAEAAPVDRTVLKDGLADDLNLFDRSIGTEIQPAAPDKLAESLTATPTADTTSVSFSPEPAATAALKSPITASKSTTKFFYGSGQAQETNPVAARPTPASGKPATSAVTATAAAPSVNDAGVKVATIKTPAASNQVTPASAQVTGDGRAAFKTSALPVEATGQTNEEPVELFLPDKPFELDDSDADVPAPRNPSTPRNDPTDDVPLMSLPGFDADEKKEFEFTPEPKNPVQPERPVVPTPTPDENIEFFKPDEPLRTTPANDGGSQPDARPQLPPVRDEFAEPRVPHSSPRPAPGDRPLEVFPEPTFPDRKSVPPVDENAPFESSPGRNDGLDVPFDLPVVNDRPSIPGNSGRVTGDSRGRDVSEVMRPQLSIQKRAPDTATVGVPHEYTIVVSNEGDSAAYDVIVDDELGSGARLETSTPIANFDRVSGKLSWGIRELAPHQKQEIVVRITPTGEGTLDGVASIRFKAQVKSATVITAPKLSLEMTSPDSVKVGDEVELHYVIRNNGSGDARNVILRSVLPPGLKHSEGGDLEYEIDNLPAGGKEIIDLIVVAAEPGNYHTVSEITISGVSADKGSTDIKIIGSQLNIQRLGPDRRLVGRSGTFQNIITNETEFEATNAVVTEQVPEGMRFVSADNGGTYNPQNGRVRWVIDRLASGKQVTLEIELEAISAGQRETVVEVTESAGFRSQAQAVVKVEDFENMTADISRQDKPVAIGESFGFTITIENRGTAIAKNVEMVIEVPPEIAVKAAGSRTVPARRQGNSVRYAIVEAIPPGEKMTFELKLQGEKQARNARVLASLKYDQMPKPLIVSEAVTIFDDSP